MQTLGLTVLLPFQLYKTERRGWGVRTLCDIPRGGFICIYVGKLYTNEEANKVISLDQMVLNIFCKR